MRGIAAGLLLAAAVSLAAPTRAQTFDAAHLSDRPGTDSDSLLAQGQAAQRGGNLDSAIDFYNRAIRAQPDLAAAYRARGDAYNARKDSEHALADFNKAVALDPDSAVYRNARGLFYRGQKQCALANADFNKALVLGEALEPGISHGGLGLCLMDANDFTHALTELNLAIDLNDAAGDPNIGAYYAARGWIRAKARDYKNAIDDYSNALSRNLPGDSGTLARVRRGEAYFATRDYTHALDDYNAVLRLEPTAAHYHARGTANMRLGHLDEALSDFNQAIAMDSTSPMAATFFGDRGALYMQRKESDRALADWNQALALDSTSTRASYFFFNRGFFYVGLGDLTAALSDLDNALSHGATGSAILNQRCWVRALANRELDGALADCEAALKIQPGNVDILDSRGFVHFRKGEFDLAIADYDEALKTRTNAAVILYHRGMARNAKGDTEGGAADIAAALKLDPHAGDEMKKFGITP